MAKRKMRLTETPGHVRIEYYDPLTGERCERHFSQTYGLTSTKDSPRYVHEHLRHGTTQACERLASTGSTLRSTTAGLAGCIRREYRKMVRFWQRELARVMRERERERVKAGLCRHCGGPVPCWSAFGDVAPGVHKANGGREGMR